MNDPTAATIVPLIQTGSTLAMMLLVLTAGVLADAFDRRWMPAPDRLKGSFLTRCYSAKDGFFPYAVRAFGLLFGSGRRQSRYQHQERVWPNIVACRKVVRLCGEHDFSAPLEASQLDCCAVRSGDYTRAATRPVPLSGHSWRMPLERNGGGEHMGTPRIGRLKVLRRAFVAFCAV
jgi:hypothetical protein